jgi:hypothetical protein
MAIAKLSTCQEYSSMSPDKIYDHIVDTALRVYSQPPAPKEYTHFDQIGNPLSIDDWVACSWYEKITIGKILSFNEYGAQVEMPEGAQRPYLPDELLKVDESQMVLWKLTL